MKALCFTGYGGADVLSVKSIARPFIEQADEVLIQVHAAGLNPIDQLRVKGDLALFYPEAHDTSVLGYDVAGVIKEVGETAKQSLKVGDEVYVRLKEMKHGGIAEYVVSSIAEVAKKPMNLSFTEAAALPLAGLTALQALRRAELKPGNKVLITGGAGGVGSLAIQIAKKMLKADYVCTTASPGSGTEICRQVGADRVIDYRSEKIEQCLAGEDFDVIFDTTNEASKVADLLKSGGKVVSIAGAPTIEEIRKMAPKPRLLVRILMFCLRNRGAEKAAKKAGGTWEYIFMKPSAHDLNEITPFVEAGEIKPLIDTEAGSLEDFKLAVDKLWSGRSKGKCVIRTTAAN